MLAPMETFILLTCLLAAPLVQTPDSHAESGAFKQPTPADRYRQVASRDNLVHPPGYVTAAPGTFGEVVERGRGDTPVILLAGLGPSWRVFDSLIEATADDYRFHAVTLAGYGGSSAPPMPPPGTSFGEHTWLDASRAALAELIEERELERPLIVAFYSDAARIALRHALQHPDQVGGILVLSASPRFPLPPDTPHGPAMDGFADQWFKTVTEIMWPSGMWPADIYANDSALSEKTWWDVLQPSLPTAIRYTVETWADDLVPDLARLETPTLVLSPGFDDEFMAGMAGTVVTERFHAGWRAAIEAGAPLEHTIVPNSRLLIWEDQPAAVHAALAQLVAGDD